MYAVLVARVEADIRETQQTVRLAHLFGSDAEWPDLDERLATFEALLLAEPEAIDDEDRELRDALGLKG